MKKFNRNVLVVVALSLAIIATLLIARWPDQTVSSAEDQRRQTLELVAPDGVVDLRDTPCGEVVRQSRPVGTLVRYISSARACEKRWLLVELLDGSGQGWVPVEAVRPPGSSGPRFSNPLVRPGNVAGPFLWAQRPLSITDEALWVRWDYSGLQAGDAVQFVLVVGDERYASRPMFWDSASAGQQWVNLLAFRPRVEPGAWQLFFYVNGEYVSQLPLQVE